MATELVGVPASLTASGVSLGIWIAALGGSWLFATWALGLSLWSVPRRQVRTLRNATVACIVELFGLAGMILVDNPGRWVAGPWLLSLLPFGLALTAVVIALCRGDVPVPRYCEG